MFQPARSTDALFWNLAPTWSPEKTFHRPRRESDAVPSGLMLAHDLNFVGRSV